MCNQIMKKEVQEAIRAGEQALQSLYHASEKLENAGKWGIFDMFAGGFFSSYMKHSRIKEAEALLEQAKTELQLFQRELNDVGEALHYSLKSEISLHLQISFWMDLLRTIWCKAKFQMPEKI